MISTFLLLQYLEGSLFAEIAKWVVMSLFLLVVLFGTFYALIATFSSRYVAYKKMHAGEKHIFWNYIKREFFSKKSLWEE